MLAENASLIDPENPDLNMMVNADVHPKLLIAMLTGKLPVSNEELNYWLSLSANSSSTVTEMSYLYFNKGDLFIPRLDLLDEANLEYFKKQTDFHLNAIQKNSKLDVNNREQLKLGYSIVSRNAEILLHLFEEPGMLENNLPTTQFWEKAVEENYTQVFHVMDILTKEMIDSLPKEKQPFFRFAKSIFDSQKDHAQLFDLHEELNGFLLNHYASFAELVSGDTVSAEFFHAAFSAQVSPEVMALILDESLLQTFPTDEKKYWSFFKKVPNNTRTLLSDRAKIELYCDAQGNPTPAFFIDAVYHSDYSKIAADLQGMITDETLRAFPEEERSFWNCMRAYPPDVANIIARREFKGWKETGITIPSKDFFLYLTGELAIQRVKNDLTFPSVQAIISPELLADFSPVEKNYWLLFKQLPHDEAKFFLSIDQAEFIAKYGNADNSGIDRDKFNKLFAMEMITRPERITQWASLSGVFTELTKVQSSTRTASYLRIAAGLTVGTITRNEVEDIYPLKNTLSGLFPLIENDDERRAWYLLRRRLPFGTNEEVRNEMKGQAVNVETIMHDNLSWVHQAIHNHVRAQNPQYMQALVDWVQKGDAASKEALEKIALFYNSDSRPPDSFYEESTRKHIKLSMPAINELNRVTAEYFRTDTKKGISTVISLTPLLEADTVNTLVTSINKVMEGDKVTSASDSLIDFLTKIPPIRAKIISQAHTVQDAPSRLNLVETDAFLSDLYQKAYVEYTTNYINTKILDGSLSPTDVKTLLAAFKNTILMGRMEGEFKSFEIVSHADVATEVFNPNSSIEKRATSGQASSGENISRLFDSMILTEKMVGMEDTDFHSFILSLPPRNILEQRNKSVFNAVAQSEMIEMLKRFGKTEEEARAQVIMTDLVNYEKESFAFLMEPLIKMFGSDMLDANHKANLEGLYFNATMMRIPTINSLYGAVPDEGMKTNNPVVDAYLKEVQEAYALPISPDYDADTYSTYLNDAKKTLDSMIQDDAFRADGLSKVVVNGYMDSARSERAYTKVQFGNDTYEFFPFTLHGADGVAILQNGKLVEEPFAKLQELYRRKIVPAMINSLKEGD